MLIYAEPTELGRLPHSVGARTVLVVGAGILDYFLLFAPHSSGCVRAYKAVFFETDRHLPYLHGRDWLFLAGDPL